MKFKAFSAVLLMCVILLSGCTDVEDSDNVFDDEYEGKVDFMVHVERCAKATCDYDPNDSSMEGMCEEACVIPGTDEEVRPGYIEICKKGQYWFISDSEFKCDKSRDDTVSLPYKPVNVRLLAAGYKEMFISDDGGANWRVVENVPVGIKKMFFVDGNTGFAAAYEGIYKTTDKGETWSLSYQTDGVTKDFLWFNDLFFLNSSHGWVTGGWGKIARTEDGGKNWVIHSFPKDLINPLRSVEFNENGYGVVTRIGGHWFESWDFGATWEHKGLIQQGKYKTLNFVRFAGSNIFIGGSGSTIYMSVNGGLSWERVFGEEGTGGSDLMSAAFLSQNVGVIVGPASAILRSSDGGLTWSEIPVGLSSGLKDVRFLNSTHGWAAGYRNTVLFTEDGGLTWHNQSERVKKVVYIIPDFEGIAIVPN